MKNAKEAMEAYLDKLDNGLIKPLSKSEREIFTMGFHVGASFGYGEAVKALNELSKGVGK